MEAINDFYSSLEEYVLSENKPDVINSRFVGTERLCYQILYDQIYVENSVKEQQELLDQIYSRDLDSSIKPLCEELRIRTSLLSQGKNVQLIPKVKQFIMEELHLRFNYSCPSSNSVVKSGKEVFPSALKSSLIDEQCASLAKENKFTSRGYEEELMKNQDPDKALTLLKEQTRKGLPGIVQQHLLHFSKTIDKKTTSVTVYYNCLDFDDLLLLQKETKKKYQFDLFSMNDYVNHVIAMFGDTKDYNAKKKEDFAPLEAIYKNRIAFLKQEKIKFFYSDTVKDYLSLLLQNEKYDKSVFVMYLESIMGKEKLRINSLMEKYFSQVFPAEKPNAYLYYVDNESLQRFYQKQCLLNDVDVKAHLWNNEEIKALSEEKWCEIMDENRRVFRCNDEVTVCVKVKNIPEMVVNVYEINTYNYIKDKGKSFDLNMSVDGLKPLHSFTEQYAQKPILVHIERFTFPSINHRGVYLVDFVAGTFSSRIMLFVGSIHAIMRKTISGHAFTFVDEYYKPMDPKRIKMVYKKNEYKCLENKAEIYIPYHSTNDGGDSVLICEEQEQDWMYCTMYEGTIETEQYDMRITGSVDTEAIVKNNEDCEIVLHTLVFLQNAVHFPLSLLKNVSVTFSITTVGDIRNQIVLHPQLKDDQDFTYKIRIADTVENLSVMISAEVVNSSGKVLTLSSSCDLYSRGSVALFRKDSVHQYYHLLHNKEGYCLLCTGVAGEEISGKAIAFEFYHVNYCSPLVITLQTDKNGIVHLGELDMIKSFSADNKDFNLYRNTYDCCKAITAGEGEDIQAVLPIVQKDISKYRLVCEKPSAQYKPLGNPLSMNEAYVMIRSLSAGYYSLFVEGDNYERYHIGITIKRSSCLPQVISCVNMYEDWSRTITAYPLAMLCHIDEGRKLEVNLFGYDERTVLHVVVKTFLENNLIQQRWKEVMAGEEPKTIVYSNPEAVVKNQSTLPKEYQYIAYRRSHPAEYPGNMLPHPGPLLHAVEYADTKNSAEDAFDRERSLLSCPRCCADCCMSESAPCAEQYSNVYLTKDSSAIENINVVSKAFFNIPISERGVASIDLREYEGCRYEVSVIASRESAVIDTHLFCEAGFDNPTLFKKTLLENNFDITKHYVENKMISCIQAGENTQVLDKSEMEVFNSLEDIYLFLLSVSKNASLSSFSFLTTWNTLSEQEKATNYNRYNCSEMNVFLYFRDRAFFNAVVLPYLQCKLEPSFLDLFLCNADVSMYLEPHLFDKLNAFEKALLSSRVSKENCAGIINGMRNAVEHKHRSPNVYDRLFNTALKLKAMTLQSKEDSSDLEEEDEAERDEMMGIAIAEGPEYSPPVPSIPESYASSRVCFAAAAPVSCMSANTERSNEGGLRGRLRMAGRPPMARMMKAGFGAAPLIKEDKQMYMKRAAAPKYYEKLEKTKEYVEGYYYKTCSMYCAPSVVPVSEFWVDFANYLSSDSSESHQPFLSSSFIYCSHSLSEILFVLSVIGIQAPITPTYTITPSDTGYNVSSDVPAFVFHKKVDEASQVENDPNYTVLMKYINMKSPEETINGKSIDRYIKTNEFIIGQPYTCKLVITNTTASILSASLLYQIPEGSYPLSSTQTMHVENISADPYKSVFFSYSFYFPYPGEFHHYPPQLIDARTGNVITSAILQFNPLHVVDQIHTVDATSWSDVASSADTTTLLAYLRSHDLSTIVWSDIAWRLVDKETYLRVIALLQQYGYYTDCVWKFGVYHGDAYTTRQFLENSSLRERVGLAFSSPLLTLYSAEDELYQIREYKPLIPSRLAYTGKRGIMNKEFESQYQRFLKYCSEKPMNANDYLVMTYYMILQERIHDAMYVFNTYVSVLVDQRRERRADCTSAIQFDYMNAYLDCYKQDLTVAREVCKKYEDYPVLYWREMFNNIREIVKEVDGELDESVKEELFGENREGLPENTIRKKRQFAEMDSSMDLSSENNTISIKYRNVESVNVNIYVMNVEYMFSDKPFIKSDNSERVYTRPNFHEHLSLPALSENESFGVFSYRLPEVFRNRSVLVEMCSGTLRETVTSFTTKLMVAISAKAGQLRVYDKETQKPLSCCYVKTYAKVDAKPVLLKEGYTDIRGYFDYFSVSSDVIDKADTIAIYVEKEGYGCCIKDTIAPTKTAH